MDILYRSSAGPAYRELPEESVKDIALGELIDHMSGIAEEKAVLKEIMVKIPTETEDMIYRQDILKDLMGNDKLAEEIKDSISSIKVLQYYGGGAKRIRDRDDSLASLLETLREIKVFVEVVEKLYKALSENEIRSPGLNALREELKKTAEDENFRAVKPDIEKIHDDLSIVKGAIVGVSLTPDMDIESVSALEFVNFKPRSKYSIIDMAIDGKINTPGKRYKHIDPLIVAMTPHMKKHLWKHTGEIKALIKKHSGYDHKLLTGLYNALVFYLAARDLGKRLERDGYEISFPEINDGPLSMKELYNIRLALKGEKEIVKNDLVFEDKEKIFILTGPNRGGKTILEQALGLISVMASLGMFVTAGSCTGRPFGTILTHFPIDENLTINYGRLGEEAIRIKSIVSRADKDSLILFNETFSTTSAADALYLSKDLLRILKEKGSAVIFNTHIHELANSIDEMNGWEGTSAIVSIAMEIKDNNNTFRIRRGAPDASSYARNIAEKYGITYEQMKEADKKGL